MIFFSKTVLRECYASFVFYHGSLLCGVVHCLPSCLIPQLKEDGYEVNPLTQSILGTIPVLVNGIAAFTIASLIGRGSRKKMLQIFEACLIVALGIMIFSTTLPLLYFGLVIAAAAVSCLTPLIVAYISEICQKERRGVLLTTSSIIFTTGSAVIFILNLFLTWRGILTAMIFIAASSFIQMFFIPESKYWHLINGDVESAKRSMLWFQPNVNTAEVDQQIKIMKQSLEPNNKSRNDFLEAFRYLRNKKVLRPFLIGVFLNLIRSGEGRVVFSVYFFDIFRHLQIPYDLKEWTAYYGVVYLVCSVGVVAVTRALARKTAVYLWACLMSVALVFLIVYKFLHNSGTVVPFWIPVIAAYIYFLLSNSGFYAAVFTITTEIQVAYCRAEMSSLLVGSICIFFGIYTSLYPHVVIFVPIEYILMYFLFSVIMVCVAVCVLLPETSSLEFYEAAAETRN